MRISTILSVLAPLCDLAASAAVPLVLSAGDRALVDTKQLELRAPKLEHPPPDHMKRKRDAGKMFTFGGYQSSISGEGHFLKLEEPIEDNGHPHPWCQAFEGSDGYTEGQEPTIHVAHMDKAENDSAVAGVPQHICWFYNDFDCDPSKGASKHSNVKITVTFLTDLSKKYQNNDDSEGNRNLPLNNKDSSGIRWAWIKAYGCMLYVDAPTAGDNTTQVDAAQGDIVGIEASAAELSARQVLWALAKRAASWVGV